MEVLANSLFEQRRLLNVNHWTSREALVLPLRALENTIGSGGLGEEAEG